MPGRGVPQRSYKGDSFGNKCYHYSSAVGKHKDFLYLIRRNFAAVSLKIDQEDLDPRSDAADHLSSEKSRHLLFVAWYRCRLLFWIKPWPAGKHVLSRRR